MTSYNVYFGQKEGLPPAELVQQVHEFMANQLRGNHATSYRQLRMHNKGSISDQAIPVALMFDQIMNTSQP